ncbi:MAG: NAD(P)/FAD-dependent oxidoreductase [Holosporales bacterium]|jgi:thioredoxin reductase (NADPH)|nr:NAD(P)/FAD-dependent oxidoreductase [Holosporales bacterium]
MIQPDIAIIGAGVAGLYAAYCCGIAGLNCAIIDSFTFPGGQCSALYPEKTVYGVPGFHNVSASYFIDKLAAQCLAFDHTELFGHRVESVDILGDGVFDVQVRNIRQGDNLRIHAKTLIIAAGICDMKPNIPRTIDGLAEIDSSSDFIQSCRITADVYKGKDIVIAGGGNSAADFAIDIIPIAKSVTLVHRRNELTCDSSKLKQLAAANEAGKLRLVLQSSIAKLVETEHTRSVFVKNAACNEICLNADHIVFCYGFVVQCSSLSWISNLNIDIRNGLISTDVNTMESSVRNCYAIGDIVMYAGKNKNIVSCCFEADRAVRMIKSKV